MVATFITDDSLIDPMWTGSAQALLSALRKIEPRIDPSDVTPHRILSILHEQRSKRSQPTDLLKWLEIAPGFRADQSESGFYHYVFMDQLRLNCENLRKAASQKLLK